MDASTLAGLLAEPDRRAVVAAMVLGGNELDEIADRAGLSTRDASDALARLASGGLVEGSGRSWVLLSEEFKAAARSRPSEAPERFVGVSASDERVLQQSLRNGRLVAMPTKRSKRLALLDHLAQQFEPGVRYLEAEVNERLATFDDDTATLRRYLVDERFLDRADGEYWRSGGTV